MTTDLVVFGATSFVGRIVCRYLLQTYPGGEGTGQLRWAMAGRSRERLQTLQRELSAQGLPCESVPLIVADVCDAPALDALCASTKVVISTVGPYALHGEPMLKACVARGIDYVDLTGEPQWIARMIRQYETAARASGARIVHCCGFDSIPSDIGVWHLQQAARERFGEPCPQVRMRVRSMKGGASGGTVASIVNLIKEASVNPSLRRELADPYSLCPDGFGPRPRLPEIRSARHEADVGSWSGPFVMAAINQRVVLRSHALLQPAYGSSFVYDEAMMTGAGPLGRAKALALAGAIGGFALGVALPPTRWALERFVLPAPGQGPSERAQQEGRFDLRFFGETAQGQRIRTRVTGDRDPGYGSTAKMLSEAAITLLRKVPEGPGGFWTPASVMGQALLERLQAHAGLRFEVLGP